MVRSTPVKQTHLTNGMNLTEFKKKSLRTTADAIAVVRTNPVQEVTAFIAEGSDNIVSPLLTGVWASRDFISKADMLEIIYSALFGASDDIRWATATSALRLSKALGVEVDLQELIRRNWPLFEEGQVTTFLAGFQGFEGFEQWVPHLRELFEESQNLKVKSQLIRTLNNCRMRKNSKMVSDTLFDLVRRMPCSREKYKRMDHFHLIKNLLGSSNHSAV